MAGRLNKSPIWQYFDIVQSNKKFVICKLCAIQISRGGIGKFASTSPLLNHFKKVHPSYYTNLRSNNPAKTGSITTGLGHPLINLPHNHIPDLHAVARARCRSMLIEAESSIDLTSSLIANTVEPISPITTSTVSNSGLGPAEIIPLLTDPQSMLQVEHSDSDNEPEETNSPPKSLLKPGGFIRKPSRSSISSTTSKAPSPESEMCLRWNSHHLNMSTVIPALMDDERYVDVSLMAEGQMLKCHKLILSSCSPYFDEMLKNTNSQQQTIIFLRDIKFWQLKALLDFMYKGEVNIDQTKLESLLKAAEDLQIKGLAGKSPQKDSIPDEDPLKTFSPAREIKAERENNAHVDEDDEDYSPYHDMKRGKYKKSRKRKMSVPPDPSSLKQVKINLKGTKSRPNIKQPKFFSPDYPEYDPDRCVSPPKADSDPLFPIDNIKMEPIDIEVPQSPTFMEMNTLMDKSLSEPVECVTPVNKEKKIVKEFTIAKETKIVKVYGKAKEKPIVEESPEGKEKVKPSTSKEIILETPGLKPNEPTKIEKITLGNKEILNINKKAIILKCQGQDVTKLIGDDTSIQKLIDAASAKQQTLTESEKSKLPQIRVRNLPTTDTMLKKFATTQLTSILKKADSPTGKHIILKKVGAKPTILRHSLPVKMEEFTTVVQEDDSEAGIGDKMSHLAKTRRELVDKDNKEIKGEKTEENMEEGEIVKDAMHVEEST